MKRFFRSLVYFLASVTLILGGVHLLRVRTARGIVLRGVKAIAEGLSPYLAVVGAVSAGLSLLMRAPLAAAAGALGALLQVSYIRRVARPHQEFEKAFGVEWQERLAEVFPGERQSALLARRWSWRMPRPLKQGAWERDMIYRVAPGLNGGPDIPLHCDLWLPPESVPASGLALLYVHGGGYYTTAKDFGTRPFFRHLTAQGHMGMDINYRLGQTANIFDMLADVQYAVAWLKDNAVLFGVDPEKIVLAGGSAGAHLALLAAYASGSPRLTPPDLLDKDLSVRGVVSYYGVIDLAAAYARMQMLFTRMVRREVPDGLLDRPMMRRALAAAAWIRGVEPEALRKYLYQNQAVLATGLEPAMRRLIGGTPEEIPETYKLLSPLTYAGPGCPPTLLFQGAHDYLLPVSVTRRLQHKLRDADVPTVYVELPQTEHTFDQFLPELSPPAQVALYDLERFLALIS